MKTRIFTTMLALFAMAMATTARAQTSPTPKEMTVDLSKSTYDFECDAFAALLGLNEPYDANAQHDVDLDGDGTDDIQGTFRQENNTFRVIKDANTNLSGVYTKRLSVAGEEYAIRFVLSKVSYPLWVGSTAVTTDNMDNILGDGKAKYNPETGVLTLDEPEITSMYDMERAVIRYDGEKPLTIEGKAELNVDGADYGIRVDGQQPLTLDGEFKVWGKEMAIYSDNGIHVAGKLNAEAGINAPGTQQWPMGIYTDGDFTFSGDSLTVTMRYGQSIGVGAGGNIKFASGVMKIQSMWQGISAQQTVSIENGVTEMYVLGQYSAIEVGEGITVGSELQFATQTPEFPYAYGTGLSDDGKYIVRENGSRSRTVLFLGMIDVALSFDPVSVELTFGDVFTAPTLLVAPAAIEATVLAEGLWSYSFVGKENESVATVDVNGNVTITGAGEATIDIQFPGSGRYRAANASYKIKVAKAEAGLSYDEAEVDGKHGEPFTAQPLNNPNGLTVTYESSDEAVAKVDAATGEVELVGEGTATITAKFEGNENYLAGEAFYVINAERHDGIPIIEEYFPDAAFRQFVADNLDGDGDGWLEDDEIEAVKYMDISKLGICDLTGLEHLVFLKELDCHGNALASLDVSTLLDLEMLFCYENELTSLDVTMLPKLRGLYCFTNQIASLDVTQNPQLEYLYCYNNLLTDIDVAENPLLLMLDVSQNALTSLDVSQNTKLELLVCYMNELSGSAMDALIASLPQRMGTSGQFRAIAPNVDGEQNAVTASQVAAAKKRGWTTFYWPGTTPPKETDVWQEYAGGETTAVHRVEESIVDSSDAWYTLDGKKLNAEPKRKGLYIYQGSKIVK